MTEQVFSKDMIMAIGGIIASVIAVYTGIVNMRNDSRKALSTNYSTMIDSLTMSYNTLSSDLTKTREELAQAREDTRLATQRVTDLQTEVTKMQRTQSEWERRFRESEEKYDEAVDYIVVVRDELRDEHEIELPPLPSQLATDVDRRHPSSNN